MSQYFDSSTSSFYRSRFPRLPTLDKGNLGPPQYGPYQQRWDPYRREWLRPDGSRAALAGLGDMVLPELDVSDSAGTRELVDKQTFVAIAAALALGLGGGWALQKHYKLAGYSLLGLGGIAAVTALLKLKQNLDAQAAYAMWNTPKGQIAGSKVWGLEGSKVWGFPPNLLRGAKGW